MLCDSPFHDAFLLSPTLNQPNIFASIAVYDYCWGWGAKGAIVYSSKPRLYSPALQCPAIYPDSNVLVQGDTENSIYRNSVQFSCRYNNQILSGPQEISCNERGEWSGTVPKCIGTASLLHTVAKCLLGIRVLNLT